MVLFIIPIALLLAGCIPLLTVTQPAVEIVVTDESGAPIEGALVNFASQLYGPDGKSKFVRVKSDQSGTIRLARESYVQIALLAVDGVAIYGFSYCIEKPGFQPAIKNHLPNKHFKASPITEYLTRSDAKELCVWNEDWRADYYSSTTP